MDSRREKIVNQECQKVAEAVKEEIMLRPSGFYGQCEVNFQDDKLVTMNTKSSRNFRKAKI